MDNALVNLYCAEWCLFFVISKTTSISRWACFNRGLDAKEFQPKRLRLSRANRKNETRNKLLSRNFGINSRSNYQESNTEWRGLYQVLRIISSAPFFKSIHLIAIPSWSIVYGIPVSYFDNLIFIFFLGLFSLSSLYNALTGHLSTNISCEDLLKNKYCRQYRIMKIKKLLNVVLDAFGRNYGW